MEKISRDVHVERYYPDVLLPAKEFKALSAAENEEFNSLLKLRTRKTSRMP